MNWPVFFENRRRFIVDCFSEHVKKPPQNFLSNRNSYGRTGIPSVKVALEPVGRAKGDGANPSRAEVLGNFQDKRSFAFFFYFKRVQKRRK